MSISVLAAIAGVMVTAVGTGLLGGRCVRSPRPSFIAWAIGMLALTVALLAESAGFATGFGALTFRVVQLSGQLVAPVTLAWGLVELVARSAAARFGARLAAVGLVVVVGVILATDPLVARPFGTTWPSASAHYQLIPHYALIGVHLTVTAVAVTAVSLCAVRDRGRPAGGQLLPGAAAVGGAVLGTVALRFALSADAAYPALSVVSAVLAWFGASRIGALAPGVSRRRAALSGGSDIGHPGRGAGAAAGTGPGGPGGSGQWLAGPWTGRQDAPDRDTSRARANAGARAQRPAGPMGPRAGGQTGGGADVEERATGSGYRDPGGGARRDGDARRERPGSGRPGAPGPYAAPGAEPAAAGPERPGTALSRRPAPGEVRSGARADGAVRPVTRPYGLIAIYTLLEDRVADFDRIATRAAEQVRAGEPDTLVYVIHTVPKAPMQRIFYEVYRDRAAYEHHEQQPYVKRFVTGRRPYVLATNVIELRLKYAKVSPLVQAAAPVRAPAGTLPAAGLQAPRQVPAPPAPRGPGQRRYGGI